MQNKPNENLLQLLTSYTPTDDFEKNDLTEMINQLQLHGNSLLHRTMRLAHFTASGFILNKALDKTLMIHHNLYNAWGWTGGHADGNGDLLAVAIKEAVEETGVKNVTPLTTAPVAIDIIPVWRHKKHGATICSHLHFNVTFFLMADELEPTRIKEDENSDVKWISLKDVPVMCNEEKMIPIYHKLIKKIPSYKK